MLSELRTAILPKHYPHNLSAGMETGYWLFRKGGYVALVMPYLDVPAGDTGSQKAKSIVCSQLTCFPLFLEKGLFLIYYGDAEKWRGMVPKFTVDKTALRPVILQSIHFIDPKTGENVNVRTQWGPLKFGFCGGLIKDIEALCHRIQQGHAPDACGAAA